MNNQLTSNDFDSITQTLTVAYQAFEQFQQGLATGEWQAFIDMLTDDFTFWFPKGEFQGSNSGKERAIAFFHYVSSAFSEGLFITLDRVTCNETTAVFEFRDEGKLRGEPYKNRVALSLDIRGNQVCGYREYFGSDGQSN